MSRDADTASVPDKAALATVLSYLKTKNLKETAEVLKKELGLAGDGGLETLPSSSTLHGSSVGQSGTEPEKYEESYASHVSCSTVVTSLSAGVQLKGLAPDQSTMSTTTTTAVTMSDYEDDGNDGDTSSEDEDEDENDVDQEIDDKEQLQSQEDISTMEASSSSNSHAPPQSLSLLPLLHPQPRRLQPQQQNGGSWAESTTTINADRKSNGNDEEEEYSDDDEDGSNAATPRLTPTQFVFTTKNPFTSQPVPAPAAATAATVAIVPSPTLSSPPSSVDRSPSWLQGKQPLTFPPPPLVPSSGVSAAAISELISSASFSPSSSSSSPPPGQLPLKVPSLQQQLRQHQQLVLAGGVSATSTTTASAVVQGEVVNSSTTPISSPPAVLGAAQLAINAGAAPFIYQLAAPAQHVGIRQSVLTPILTFLPNAQSLVAAAAGRQVGSAIPQPVILSPPGHALSVPLASSASPALVSSLTAAAKMTNGVALPQQQQQQQQQQKSIFEQSLGLSQQAHQVLSTEPTTGQQTLSSPVVDLVTSTARNGSPPRTLASIPLSEMTPQYSELKAFAEEFKNKRIRLGFTQGAVGQSLADKGYSNFAQSTISRFEQMQLSPTNAAAIKLVLEKWLQETENPEAAHSPSSSSPLVASRKRKRRAVFTPQTKTTLETYFKQNPRPNRHVIESVAHELDLLPEEVRVWFCNKRQKEKQGSGGCAPTAVTYKYPYERESSVSLSSSGANSPCGMYESSSANSVFPKRNTPSPPRNTTPFTIEELSKSSSTSTKTISSPMCIAASPFATSPQGVVMALTTPRISFTAQPAATVTSPPATVILPQLRVSQTTA